MMKFTPQLNKFVHWALSLTIMVSLVLALCVTALAAAEDVAEPMGSITVTMKANGSGKLAKDGKLSIYHVAAVVETEQGDYALVYTEDYEEFSISVDDLMEMNTTASAALVSWNRRDGIQPLMTKRIRDGEAVFDQLDLGLYLVVQSERSSGFARISPFLVSLPWQDGKNWHYAIDANPKLSIVTGTDSQDDPEGPGTPDEPDQPDTPDEPDIPVVPGEPDAPVEPDQPQTPDAPTPDKPTLPQTGLYTWPIYLLGGSGVLLIAAGWLLRREKRHEA